MIIRPDGSRSVVEFSLGEADDSVYHVWISDTGRVFATTYGPSVYEIKEDGSSEIFLTLDAGYEMPNLIQFSGNLMILDGELYDGLLIYDMEKEEYVEDEVLNEFVNQSTSKGLSDVSPFTSASPSVPSPAFSDTSAISSSFVSFGIIPLSFS